jgi:hypothetical protein
VRIITLTPTVFIEMASPELRAALYITSVTLFLLYLMWVYSYE